MVEVPDHVIATFAIERAIEYGEYDVPSTIGLGEYGQYETELDWSMNDVTPESCEVEMIDENIINVHDTIEASYSEQVSRRTRHHPAEYEHHTTPLHITIVIRLDTLDTPTIVGELV